MAKRVVATSLLAFALAATAACGGDEKADTTGRPGEIEFELESTEGAAEGVRARLAYLADDRTRVIVDGLDAGEPAGGGPNPVRLLGGSCTEPNDVLATLEPLSGSESSSEVDFGLAELMAGDFSIEVALPGGSAGEAVACGDVPSEAPTSS